MPDLTPDTVCPAGQRHFPPHGHSPRKFTRAKSGTPVGGDSSASQQHCGISAGGARTAQGCWWMQGKVFVLTRGLQGKVFPLTRGRQGEVFVLKRVLQGRVSVLAADL